MRPRNLDQYIGQPQVLGAGKPLRRAIESDRLHSLILWGPPGTGKSYTITAIVLDALLRGQTVLVASQMDKAVEVVARQVEKIAGPYALARSGGRSAQRELADKIQDLRDRLMRTLTGQFDQELARSVHRIRDAVSPYTRFVRAERQRLETIHRDLTDAQDALIALQGELDEL